MMYCNHALSQLAGTRCLIEVSAAVAPAGVTVAAAAGVGSSTSGGSGMELRSLTISALTFSFRLSTV